MRHWLLVSVVVGLFFGPFALAQGFDRAYEEGLVLLKAGRFEDARVQFEQSVQEQARSDNLFALGVVYFRLQQTRLAYETYMQALRRVPSPRLEARIRSGLGDVYFEMEDYLRAAESYRKALAVEPVWIGARLKLATAYLRQGQYVSALAESESLQNQGVPVAESYYLQGLVFLARQDWPAAEAALHKLKAYPRHRVEALQHLNWLYRMQKEFDLAVEMALEIQNTDGATERLIAVSLLEKAQACSRAQCLSEEELRRVRRALERWILSHPENPRAYQGLGELEQRLGHWKEASQAYRRAAMLFPEYPLFQLKALGMDAAQGLDIAEPLRALSLPEAQRIQPELWWELSKWQSLLQAQTEQASTLQGIAFWQGLSLWLPQERSSDRARRHWKNLPQGNRLENTTVQALQFYEKGAYEWALKLFEQASAQAPAWWLPHYYIARIRQSPERYEKSYWEHPNHLELATMFVKNAASRAERRLRLERVLRSFPQERLFQEQYLRLISENAQ